MLAEAATGALGFAVAAAAAAGAPAAPPPSEPRWVVARDNPSAGEVIEAWLFLPPPPEGAPGEVEVRLVETADLGLWPRSDGGCAGSRPPRSSALRPAGAPAGPASPAPAGLGSPAPASLRVDRRRGAVVAACAQARRPMSTRLLAELRAEAADDSAGGPAEVRLVASDPLEVRPRYELGPVELGAISGATGFVFGVLAAFFERWLERRWKGKRLREELVAGIVRHLLPDLNDNAARLDRFLASPAAPPEVLQMRAYNALQDAKGPFSVLSPEERQGYLDRVKQLHDNQATFNALVRREEVDKARQLAPAILEKIAAERDWSEEQEATARAGESGAKEE